MFKIKKLIKCILNLQYIRSYVKGVSPLFELSKLLKKINTIETLIDVGSNKGQFILITKKFFPNISIHSFEPLNEELSIQKSILKNNNIYYYNLALGNEENEDNIYITKRKDSSSLLKPKIGISEIYKTNEIRKIKISKIDKILCAKYRTGHFEGVLAVMHRFMSNINSNYVFLGEKDFQQIYLKKKYLYKKNSFKVIACKTVRNKNKLPLSSRNILLSKKNIKKSEKISK